MMMKHFGETLNSRISIDDIASAVCSATFELELRGGKFTYLPNSLHKLEHHQNTSPASPPPHPPPPPLEDLWFLVVRLGVDVCRWFAHPLPATITNCFVDG